jgi:hypothetical protein
MSTPKIRKRLIKVLTGLRKFGSDAETTAVFRQAFTDFGSETPDNLASVRRIVVSTKKHPLIRGTRVRGLRLRSRGWLLSDIVWAMEGGPIPIAVRRDFPGITREEWAAVGRVVTMIFTLFGETEQPPDQSLARRGSALSRSRRIKS